MIAETVEDPSIPGVIAEAARELFAGLQKAGEISPLITADFSAASHTAGQRLAPELQAERPEPSPRLLFAPAAVGQLAPEPRPAAATEQHYELFMTISGRRGQETTELDITRPEAMAPVRDIRSITQRQVANNLGFPGAAPV